jgi:3-oxoacyl-[acyl-carrier-protein] synthase III
MSAGTGARLTVKTGPAYAGLLGIGGYRPVRSVDNEEICRYIDSSDAWIRERTGIVSRGWAGPQESVISMATAAGGKAIAAAGLQPEQIGFVLVATITHGYQTPSAAVEIAYELGATQAAAVDLSAACSGFCHGVAIANDMVRGGSVEHVLVIGVEKLMDFIDRTDRSVGFIFADGAGAAVIGPVDRPSIGPTVWGADGSQLSAIAQATSWANLRESDRRGAALDGGDGSYPFIGMQGQAVFRWAVTAIPKVAQAAMDAAGLSTADLDVFVPHQANLRIIDALVKKLALPEHVVVARDIVDTGNTSAASVPLSLDRLIETGQVRSGQTALLVGFGAGLTYAAQVVVLP